MLSNNLKLKQVEIELYTLQIGYPITDAQIYTKLKAFSGFEEEKQPLLLQFAPEFEISKLDDIIKKISTFSNEFGIRLHAILDNGNMPQDTVAGVPVISGIQHKNLQKNVTNTTLIIDEPVRSGLVVENDGDVIVTSFVSDNAEVIATGNIHVYNEARGRLIAGKGGNKKARIFVTKFNAELIAIGGIYRVIDSKLPEHISYKSVMISLDDKDKLLIVPFKDK